MLEDTFNISLFTAWILLNCGVAIWAYFYYDSFTWSRFWHHFIINIYPGSFVILLITELINPFMPNIIRNLYWVSKQDLSNFTLKKLELKTSQWDLKEKIAAEENRIMEDEKQKKKIKRRQEEKEKEITMLNDLKLLITNIESKQISTPDAYEWFSLLNAENRKIKESGYQVEKSLTFTNLFKKIEKLLETKSDVSISTLIPRKLLPANNLEVIETNDTETTINSVQDEISISTETTLASAPTKDNYYEETTVSEIFGEPTLFIKNPSTKSKTTKILPKQDYQIINKNKMDIGDAGELFVYWKEKNKLFQGGFKKLSDQVHHVSKESDSHGYDIQSYFEDGTPVYLEVKTTTG